MNGAAQSACEAARLLRISGERVPAVPDAATLATSAAGLLGIAAREAPERAAMAHLRGAMPAVADPMPRSWWQRLFGMRR